MLAKVAEADIDDVLIEAGPTLFTSLWHEGLIDELVVVMAGGVGGNSAPALYCGMAEMNGDGLHTRLRAVEAGVIGADAVSVWRPHAAGSASDVEKGSA